MPYYYWLQEKQVPDADIKVYNKSLTKTFNMTQHDTHLTQMTEY